MSLSDSFQHEVYKNHIIFSEIGFDHTARDPLVQFSGFGQIRPFDESISSPDVIPLAIRGLTLLSVGEPREVFSKVWLPDKTILFMADELGFKMGSLERKEWMSHHAQYACDLKNDYFVGKVYYSKVSSFSILHDNNGCPITSFSKYEKPIFESCQYGLYGNVTADESSKEMVLKARNCIDSFRITVNTPLQFLELTNTHSLSR